MIYFTKNITPENRKAGEYLLGYYWRASAISKAPYYPITNWQGMLAYLDKNYPSYIEALGEELASGSMTQDDLIKSMQDAAARGLTDYPRPAYFAVAISANAAVDDAAVIGETAKDVASTISNFTIGSFYTLIFVGLLVYGFVIYEKSGGKLKIPKLSGG